MMAEGLETGDGKALDLDAASKAEQDFARAMATPPDSDDKAPPKRAEKQPKAVKGDEKPRVSRGPGRPAKAVSGLSREVRVEGVKGLVQLAATGCALAGRAVPGQAVALQADAVVLASNADQVAEAVADTCAADEKFARTVDRICSVGPYGALISVGLSIGLQCARNHGAQLPGTVAPEDILQAASEMQAAA